MQPISERARLARVRRWKPKPRAVRAWACGVCGRRFRSKNDPNLAMCCTCGRCGGPSLMKGGAYTCKRCNLLDSIERDANAAEQYKVRVDEYRAQLAALDNAPKRVNGRKQ